MRKHAAVLLTIQKRDCEVEEQKNQGDPPVRVGRIPLLALDWVVDLVQRRLAHNPEHEGEWIIDAY
jgi:hypothetical protein